MSPVTATLSPPCWNWNMETRKSFNQHHLNALLGFKLFQCFVAVSDDTSDINLDWKISSSPPTLTMTLQWAGSVVDLKRYFIITILLWDMSCLHCLTPQQTFRQIHHLLQQVFLWFIMIIIIMVSLLSPCLLGKIIWLFKPSGKYLT